MNSECTLLPDYVLGTNANRHDLHEQRLERRQVLLPELRVLEGQEDRLRALVTAQPDATLAELRDALRTFAALATIWRELNQLDLTVKKNCTCRRTTAR